MPDIDVQTGVTVAFVVFLLLGIFSLAVGLSAIRAGRSLQYFRKRRERIVQGWRLVLAGLILGAIGLSVNQYAEPVAYRFFPPSPTVTLTPTITATPTITVTPSISPTPTITNTPSVTNTPSIPEEVFGRFESTTTPAAEPVFSPLVFARELDENFQPIEPAEEFENPITKLYGVFSYDQMTPGAQWTALWTRNGELVGFETLPWNGGSGGIGYTELEPASETWTSGLYEVQLFVGERWVQSSTFTVTGDPPTSTPTVPPTRTPVPTRTVGPTPTRTNTPTLTPSRTPTVTNTPTITRTPTITMTPTITRTLRPTDTSWPTLTREIP